MPKRDDTQIAGYRTAQDWCDFRDEFNLSANPSPEIWVRAFDEYFYPRLETRYLQPIEAIKKIGKAEGEGFSMMAILCTLVEFLESTVQGRNYAFGEKETDLVYPKSDLIFISFLEKRPPFSGKFNDGLAKDFYIKIRCGLLHEAKTKGGWRILEESQDQSTIIDRDEKIVYRNDFQLAIKQFIAWYRNELQAKQKFQEAFIRKFDHLCE
ncbi:MAG: hypothetical protein ACYCZS_11675 [Thiobacillus sp.]